MKLILMLQDKNLLIRSILCNCITSQHLLLDEVLPKSYFTSTMLQSCNLSKFVFGNSQSSNFVTGKKKNQKSSFSFSFFICFIGAEKHTIMCFRKKIPAIFKNFPYSFFNFRLFIMANIVWKVLIPPFGYLQ